MPQKWQITKDETTQAEAVKSGKGIPRAILDRLADVHRTVKNKSAKNLKKTNSRGLFDVSDGASESSQFRPPFSEFSLKFNLEEYESDEDEQLDPLNANAQLDVTALDRYNEDVRKYRRILLEECRLIPLKGDIDKDLLERVRVAANDLSRSCYYGTYKAHALGESSVTMFIWLLSRRNMPIWFHMRILQSLSELVWASHNLKMALLPNGVKVLIRLLRGGMAHHSSLATWACYTLLSASIGCGEVVEATAAYPKIDEYLGEISFPHYWKDWPANFGSILEGVILGPHAVSPLFEDDYQFR